MCGKTFAFFIFGGIVYTFVNAMINRWFPQLSEETHRFIDSDVDDDVDDNGDNYGDDYGDDERQSKLQHAIARAVALLDAVNDANSMVQDDNG